MAAAAVAPPIGGSHGEIIQASGSQEDRMASEGKIQQNLNWMVCSFSIAYCPYVSTSYYSARSQICAIV